MFSKIIVATVLALACTLSAFAATPVNINKADASTIAKALDGIGQAKAQAIVAWRTEHGPFKSATELTQVKGIGQSLIDRNHDAILLSGAGAAVDAKADAPKAQQRKAARAVAAQ
jgi:competence protein ComEA helix-hairpin-helix repeat region